MDEQLWTLFRETGDPLCYLLCKAGESVKTEQSAPAEKPSPESGARM